MNKVRTSGLIARANAYFAASLISLISGYRYFISPLLGSNCRYHPSCSEYAQDALRRHGWVKGSFLALRRLSRCHPWGRSGYDPVP